MRDGVEPARAGAEARDALRGLRQAGLRQLLPLGLLAVVLARPEGVVSRLDFGGIAAAVAATPPAALAAGLGLTALSFAAVGGYDVVLHGAMCSRVAPRRAARTGMAAVALCQLAGLGLISGTLARWRLLPGLGLAGALRLTLAVTASFLGAAAMLAALSVAVLGPAWAGPAERAAAATAAGLAIAACALLPRPAGTAFGRRWRGLLPGPRTCGLMLVLAAADTVPAAGVLWLMLPADAPGLAAVYPAYLLALIAGLVIGTPGGIGGFELALLALLPGLPETGVLAGILGYRLVYQVVPALIATPFALLGGGGRDPAAPEILWPDAGPARARLRRLAGGLAGGAELRLLAQGTHGWLPAPVAGEGWLVGPAGGWLIGLFDPAGQPRDLPAALARLRRGAAAAGRRPCLYKCGPRCAAHARRAGFAVLPVAEDLWLDPRGFTTDGAARAALRRKLRHAARSGVSVADLPFPATAGDGLPLRAMAGLSAGWAARHGGERGFSMGRFAPDYLAAQRVFLARRDGRPVAFVSFHATPGAWTLDLMRSAPDMPDGAMHQLIVAALAAARAEGVARLSLAAVPIVPPGLPRPLAAVLRAAQARAGAAGLRQFKAAFAPRAERRYLATPSRLGLAGAALAIARQIRRPPPLPPAGQGDRDRRSAS